MARPTMKHRYVEPKKKLPFVRHTKTTKNSIFVGSGFTRITWGSTWHWDFFQLGEKFRAFEPPFFGLYIYWITPYPTQDGKFRKTTSIDEWSISSRESLCLPGLQQPSKRRPTFQSKQGSLKASRYIINPYFAKDCILAGELVDILPT